MFSASPNLLNHILLTGTLLILKNGIACGNEAFANEGSLEFVISVYLVFMWLSYFSLQFSKRPSS